MRTFLLAFAFSMLFAVPQPVLASPGTPPVIVESTFLSEPRVGEAAELRVRITANREAGPAHLRLEVPDWVEVRAGGEWVLELGRGVSAEHVWTVVATRGGFWRVGLSHATGEDMGGPVEPDAERQLVGGCCLHVFSWDGQARWSVHPSLAVPPARFDTRLGAALAEGDVVRLHVEAELLDAWASKARVDARVGHMGFEDTVMELPLEDGASVVVTEWVTAHVAFDRSETMRAGEALLATGGASHCRNVELARTGDVVREARSWSCETGVEAGVPAPAGALLLVGVALAAVGRRSARFARAVGLECPTRGPSAPDKTGGAARPARRPTPPPAAGDKTALRRAHQSLGAPWRPLRPWL